MRRPVRTITLPPISSRRMRFGDPTSPRPSGVTVAPFSPSPCSRIAAAASLTTRFSVARRFSSERSKRGNSSSTPITSGRRTRRASSSSSWPVWSPSRTTIVCSSRIGGQCRQRPSGTRNDGMPWTRRGRKGAFRYLDQHGREIRDAAKVERIEKLAIPSAWKEVRISPSSTAMLQATGLDKAGRKQYLYHADFRAAQEQAKYDKLIRFAEKLPELRAAMAEHLDNEELDRERVSAIALRLINLGWFRVGSDRYVRGSGTYGITTLTRRHVTVRGHRVTLAFRGKHKIQVRTSVVDEELAGAMRELLEIRGGARVFRYEWEGDVYNLTSKRLNDYVKLYLGQEFTAKDFRTWGGTLLTAIGLAERASREGFPETKTDEKRSVSAVMRRVAQQLGNTPAVCRASYVSPAVIEQYLEGRTLEDFRPRHLRVVGARDAGLDPEELALLTLLRSWRIRQARVAA